MAMSALIVKAKCILLLSLREKGNKSISRALATNWVPGCRLEHSTIATTLRETHSGKYAASFDHHFPSPTGISRWPHPGKADPTGQPVGLRRGAGIIGEVVNRSHPQCWHSPLQPTGKGNNTHTHTPCSSVKGSFLRCTGESWHLVGGSSLGPRMHRFTCSGAGVPGCRILVPWK